MRFVDQPLHTERYELIRVRSSSSLKAQDNYLQTFPVSGNGEFLYPACYFNSFGSWGTVRVDMEYFVEELKMGRLTIELSIEEGKGCRVIFTAKDEENRRVWKTPVMDLNGEIKIYENQEDAIHDAKKKLGAAV